MDKIDDVDIRVEKCKRKEDYWDFYDKIVELINSDEMIKSVFGGREKIYINNNVIFGYGVPIY